MLQDVGVRFRFDGGPQAVSGMDRVRTAFDQLKSSISGIKTAVTAAVASMAAIGTAGAMIPYKLATTREQLSRAQGSLRHLGMSQEDLKQLENDAMRFTNKYAGFTTEAWTQAFYQIQSTMGELSTKQKTSINNMSLRGGKVTEMDAKQSTDYMTMMWGALKHFYKGMDPEEFTKMVWAQTQKTVELSRTRGPQIMEALSHAAPILGRQGWKLEDMLGATAALQTAGFKPEMAGTALRNMNVRGRDAMSKILGEAVLTNVTGKQDAWDRLKGDQQKKVLKVMEGIIDKTKLLQGKGPIPMLRALQAALNEFGAGKQDKLLKDAFGDETVAQVATLTAKIKDLEELIKQLKAAGWKDWQGTAPAANLGIHSQMDLIVQRWHNMWMKMGTIVEPTVCNALDAIGQKFVQVTEWIMPRQEQLQAAVSSFASGFANAFSSTFTAASSLGGKLSELVGLLDKPDATKFAQIGQELGKVAGVSLNKLVSDLQQIAAAAGVLAGALGQGAAALRSVADAAAPYLSTADEVMKAIQPVKDATVGKGSTAFALSGIGAFSTGITKAKALWDRLSENSSTWFTRKEPAVTPAQPGASDQNVGWSMRPQLWGPAAVPAWAPVMPSAMAIGSLMPPRPIDVQVDAPKVDVQVQVGDRVVEDIVVRTVRNELARHRMGHNDAFGMPGM